MSQEAAARRAIVQVRWGPMAYRKAIIEPGQVLRVGRAGSMGLAVPHDERMAEAHFELSWSGSRGWLKDLSPCVGTLLGGQRVEQGEVFNGSWVRAGRTDFSIYFERTTPPPEPEVPDSQELTERKMEALEVLRSQEQPLFAILDAAQSERILNLLQESVEEYRSLYEGPQGEFLADVAPYLVELPRESFLLDAIIQEAWGRSWGVYLSCDKSLWEIRRHLRKLLMVEADGVEERVYFRFYDPQVLNVFLRHCTRDHRKEFFGPVRHFVIEGDGGEPHVVARE